MKKQLISILITNYNKSKFLKKNLSSIVNQNYKNFEVIIYDDNSTDQSLQIINQYCKRYKNFQLVLNKKKKFISPALNQIRGINKIFSLSKGQIICLMDADDFFLREKLERINFYFINNNQKIIYDFPKSTTKQFKYIKKKNNKIWPSIFPTSCISARKKYFKIFLDHLKPKDLPNLEIDARINIFYKFYYNEYNFINKKLTIYNYDENSITAKIDKFSKKWWLRRNDAFEYLIYILNIRNQNFKYSADYLITKFLSFIFKI